MTADRRRAGSQHDGLLGPGPDPLQEIAATARLVEAVYAGVVLTDGGSVLPLPGLPGLPGHRLLARRSPVLTSAARELAAGGTFLAFLAPTAGDGGEGASCGSACWIAPAPASTSCAPRCCSARPGICAP